MTPPIWEHNKIAPDVWQAFDERGYLVASINKYGTQYQWHIDMIPNQEDVCGGFERSLEAAKLAVHLELIERANRRINKLEHKYATVSGQLSLF